MAWNFNQYESVFSQIANRLKLDIFNGKYPLGSQMPSVRQLAVDASVNPNTMQRALAVLEEEGLVYSHGTVGRFVTADAETVKHCKMITHKKMAKRLVDYAKEHGITAEDLIAYIKEEEKIL